MVLKLWRGASGEYKYSLASRPNLSVQISEEQAQSLSPILPSHNGREIESTGPLNDIFSRGDILSVG